MHIPIKLCAQQCVKYILHKNPSSFLVLLPYFTDEETDPERLANLIICEATMWLTQIGPRLPNFQAHLLIHHIQMDGLHHLHTRSIRTQKKPAPSLHENCLKTVSKAILSSRLNHRSPLMFLNADDFHVPIIITITTVIRTTIY